MAKNGRKPKYTPELVSKLTYVIGMGLSVQLACRIAGISEHVFYEWLQKKHEFKSEIESAKEKRELTLLKEIYEQGDVKDKITLTKMLYPKYNSTNIKLSGDAQNPIAVNSSLGISKERLKELIQDGYSPQEILEKLG